LNHCNFATVMKGLRYILLLFFFTNFIGNDEKTYRYLPNNCFSPGEQVEYRVHYGFFNAGEAKVVLHEDLYEVNGRVCYKVELFGNTTGLFDWIVKIRDTWGTYIDTTSIVPHHFYRLLQEGSYRKFEYTNFDHKRDTVIVTTLNKITKEVDTIEDFKVPDNAQDMVSGYYYLRIMDFSKLTPGDTLTIPAFLDDESFQFKIKYLGKEAIRSRIGNIESLVMEPIMPKNGIFSGKDAIKFWISDDQRKIPLKIRAQLFIGAVEVDITDYQEGY